MTADVAGPSPSLTTWQDPRAVLRSQWAIRNGAGVTGRCVISVVSAKY